MMRRVRQAKWVSHRLVPATAIALVAAVLMGPAARSIDAAPQTGALKQLWMARYDGPQDQRDEAEAVATSPDGTMVYVTGFSNSPVTSTDYATIAYDASTGEQKWVARYSGPGKAIDTAIAIGVSPDGTAVFVTGVSPGTGTGTDYATVAYDSLTGTELWVARFSSPGRSRDSAEDLAVSPDGATVFVTGSSEGPGSDGVDFATVAYDAATGGQDWVARYNGPVNDNDLPFALALSPDGGTLFVTGYITGSNSSDIGTIAYDAVTGSRRWVAVHDGPLHGSDIGYALAISPGGETVYVTGLVSVSPSYNWDYATVAYDAATGNELWVTDYDGPGNQEDTPYAIAVSPDGGTVFVTGSSQTTVYENDYATVAYDATTGAQQWAARFGRPNLYGSAKAVTISPDGGIVYVTGIMQVTYTSGATVAYDAGTGGQHALTVSKVAHGNDLALSPDGSTLFVTGEVSDQGGGTSHDDFATIAYDVAGP
jgi:DNA-binding beta-propeller fold protein YncE